MLAAANPRGPPVYAASIPDYPLAKPRAQDGLVLLQDLGSVQTLDGADHHERKQAFMTLLEAGAVRRLVEAAQGCTCSAWDTVA